MKKSEKLPRRRRPSRRHRGSTIVLVAASLIVIIGALGLAIDLGTFYVARNEAQRAADAAALAGASIFVVGGCTDISSGCVIGGPQESLARTQAIQVAAQNTVGGSGPSSASVATSFSYPNPQEPQITVTVYRDSAHGNAMPTFFARIFGITSGDISATAIAEAFNSTGSSVSIATQCLRPFLVPNCDPIHKTPANAACDTAAGYFIDPTTRTLKNPGVFVAPSGGGVLGQDWVLHTNSAPSQWNLIAFTGESGSALRTYIKTCAPQVIACNAKLNLDNGAKTGPVDQGVEDLIHADGLCLGQGQDSICSPTSSPACTTQPFPITGGTNNPNPGLVGQTVSGASDSKITVAVYQPPLNADGSANIIGYMQVFITQVIKGNGNPCSGNGKDVDVVILGISACGTNAGGTPVTGQGGSFIPIRLIH